MFRFGRQVGILGNCWLLSWLNIVNYLLQTFVCSKTKQKIKQSTCLKVMLWTVFQIVAIWIVQIPIPNSNSEFQFRIPIPNSNSEFQFQIYWNIFIHKVGLICPLMNSPIHPIRSTNLLPYFKSMSDTHNHVLHTWSETKYKRHRHTYIIGIGKFLNYIIYNIMLEGPTC